ncbi:ABC transporter permease [Qipengyuania citrea]|uniref:ABC transporter permease n=1 Tax=Qipengyuania citrea TaxID=225971 RepID=UPI0032974DE0
MMTTTLIPATRLYALESLAEIRKSWRLPQFILPTILLPVAFYGLFAIAMGDGDTSTAAYALATFGVFAAIGPSLFGFGVGVADERAANLIELKRVSPLPGGAYIAGKIAASVLFTGVAVLAIYALGTLAGGVRLSAERWFVLLTIHLASVAPFALIGLGVGMRMTAKGAVAAANFLFLGFAVLGGLWFPIDSLPDWLRMLAWITPSWHLGELALMAIGLPRANGALLHAGVLVAMTAGAAVFAASGWRRSAF